MGDYLNTVGIGEFFYVCGMKDSASHAWLEVDELIAGITGDQFFDRFCINPGELGSGFILPIYKAFR